MSPRAERMMVPPAHPTSYYGQPVLKQPVWEPDIAIYFYTGGVAGGSLLLAAAAHARGERMLARSALLVAEAALAISPVLLIRDLGKPERFLNMLRVFKVTSPMSVGTWLLSATGATATVALGLELLDRMPTVRALALATGAVLGAGLTTYTAALVADTAVPVWHEARRELPAVFASTALATTGAAALVAPRHGDAGLARRLCVGGAAATAAAMAVMERRLGPLAAPYREEKTSTAALAATLGGAALVLVGRRRRALERIGATAVLVGGLLERFSVFSAGRASAGSADAVVRPQRERLDRGEGSRQREQQGDVPVAAMGDVAPAPEPPSPEQLVAAARAARGSSVLCKGNCPAHPGCHGHIGVRDLAVVERSSSINGLRPTCECDTCGALFGLEARALRFLDHTSEARQRIVGVSRAGSQ